MPKSDRPTRKPRRPTPRRRSRLDPPPETPDGPTPYPPHTKGEANHLARVGFEAAMADEVSAASTEASTRDFHDGPEPPPGRRGELTLAGDTFDLLAPPEFTYYDVNEKAVVDHEARKRYLITLARSGREMLACHAAGVHIFMMKRELKGDPEFARLREEAWAIYCDRVIAATGRLAFEGVWEPVIGRRGRDHDAVIGWKRRIEYRALEAEQRRCVPEYRQHAVLDVNARVGVLVVRQPMSPEAWAAAYGGDDKLTKDPLEGIPGAHAALEATRLDPNGLDGKEEEE